MANIQKGTEQQEQKNSYRVIMSKGENICIMSDGSLYFDSEAWEYFLSLTWCHLHGIENSDLKPRSGLNSEDGKDVWCSGYCKRVCAVIQNRFMTTTSVWEDVRLLYNAVGAYVMRLLWCQCERKLWMCKWRQCMVS